MRILVIADLQQGQLAANLPALVGCANQLGGELDVLLAGESLDEAAQQACVLEGVNRVLVAEDPILGYGLAEPISQLATHLAKDYQVILAAASTTGKDFLPRTAALLDLEMLSDIIAVEGPSVFVRPIYAGNLQARMQVEGRVVATVRTSAFAACGQQASCAIEPIALPKLTSQSCLVSREQVKSDRPELGSAKLVVSGGRGLGSKEQFVLVEQLADALGAAVGASRAAVDAGFISNDHQVGQTGKIVAPELYVAVGISGAIQHLAGMKESKLIVAINKDPEAPIMQMADFALEADLFTAVPELMKALAK